MCAHNYYSVVNIKDYTSCKYTYSFPLGHFITRIVILVKGTNTYQVLYTFPVFRFKTGNAITIVWLLIGYFFLYAHI